MEMHEEIMEDKKLSTMKYKVPKVINTFGALILLSACGNRGGNTGIHVAHSPSWGVKSETSSAHYIPEEKAVEPEQPPMRKTPTGTWQESRPHRWSAAILRNSAIPMLLT